MIYADRYLLGHESRHRPSLFGLCGPVYLLIFSAYHLRFACKVWSHHQTSRYFSSSSSLSSSSSSSPSLLPDFSCSFSSSCPRLHLSIQQHGLDLYQSDHGPEQVWYSTANMGLHNSSLKLIKTLINQNNITKK